MRPIATCSTTLTTAWRSLESQVLSKAAPDVNHFATALWPASWGRPGTWTMRPSGIGPLQARSPAGYRRGCTDARPRGRGLAREARRIRRALPDGLAARAVVPPLALLGPKYVAVVAARTVAAGAVAHPLRAGLPHPCSRWCLRRGRKEAGGQGEGGQSLQQQVHGHLRARGQFSAGLRGEERAHNRNALALDGKTVSRSSLDLLSRAASRGHTVQVWAPSRAKAARS